MACPVTVVPSARRPSSAGIRQFYFLPGSGRGGGVLLAAAAPLAVLVAFGFLASRLDFCSPFAMFVLLLNSA